MTTEEARLVDAEREAIWTCECGHSVTRHNSQGCTAKVTGGEFADDCKVSLGAITEANVERLKAEWIAQAKAEARNECREEVTGRIEAFLPSDTLAPAWIAGWHAAINDASHVLSLPRFRAAEDTP